MDRLIFNRNWSEVVIFMFSSCSVQRYATAANAHRNANPFKQLFLLSWYLPKYNPLWTNTETWQTKCDPSTPYRRQTTLHVK